MSQDNFLGSDDFANFIEVGRMLCALKSYSELDPNPDVDHIKKGLDFARKNEELLERGCEALEGFGFAGTTTATPLLRSARRGVFVGRGEKNPAKVDDYVEGMRIILSKLSANVQTIKGAISEARHRTALNAWSSAIDGETFVLKELASSAKVGSFTYGRKWMKEAFSKIEIPSALDSTKQLMADMQGALGMAEKIKDLNTQIISGAGDRELAETQRDKALNELMEEASVSSNPAAVITAVASKIGAPSEHRSVTGAELGLSPEQEDAMLVTGRSIIAAGAGSGKTRVLAGKIVHLLRSGVEPGQIMACSFTAKSANELKERIVKYGGGRIVENDIGFGTTHSIALKLLQTIDPMYRSDKMILSDDALLREAITQVTLLPNGDDVSVGRSPTGPVSFLDEEVSTPSSEEDILLQAIISKALSTVYWVRDNHGISGPRAAWARGDLALFEGLKEKGDVKVSDLTSGEKRALNKYFETNRGIKTLNQLSKSGLGSGPGFKLASRFKLAEDDVDQEDIEGAEETEGNDPVPVNQWFNMGIEPINGRTEDNYTRNPGSVALEISKFKSEMVSPSEAWDRHQNDHLMAAALIYNAYEWLKNRDGMMDHDDYMIRLIQALASNKERLEKIRSQYKHIMVDEAQDLNKIQHTMFGLISGHIDPDTLMPNETMTAETYCLIGDDKQAIYEFRGAKPETFIENSDSLGGMFKTKMITTNYRSGANIINAANQLMLHNEKQIPMTCNFAPSRGEGQIGTIPVANAMDGAMLAIKQIKENADLEGWDSWNEDFPKYGVACRTNKEIADYILACVYNDIPFKAKPGINPFTSKTYRILFSAMDIRSESPKAIYRSIYGAYKTFKFGLDKKFVPFLKANAKENKMSVPAYFFAKKPVYTSNTHAFRNEQFYHPYVDFLSAIRNFPGDDAVAFFDYLMDYDLGEAGTVRDIVLADQLAENAEGSISSMASSAGTDDEKVSGEEAKSAAMGPLEVIRQMCVNIGSLNKVVETLISFRDKSAKLQVSEEDKAKAVVLDTCHGWKGLEAKHIYVPMADGVFPSKRSVAMNADPADMESERRLAYVALTRGRDSVTIIEPAVSTSGDEVRPSRFTDEACIRPFSSNLKQASFASRVADQALADMILDDYGFDF